MSASDLFGDCCRYRSELCRHYSTHYDFHYCALLHEDAMFRSKENDQRYLHSWRERESSLSLGHTSSFGTIQHNTVQLNTVQYSTVCISFSCFISIRYWDSCSLFNFRLLYYTVVYSVLLYYGRRTGSSKVYSTLLYSTLLSSSGLSCHHKRTVVHTGRITALLLM